MNRLSASTVRRTLALVALFTVGSVAPLLVLDLEKPEAFENIAAEARIESRNTLGITSWILRGPFSPEGASLADNKHVIFAPNLGELKLDLGQVTDVKSLLLQAHHQNEFTVEASVQGSHWQTIWEVPRVSVPGLRTRGLLLPEIQKARFLRIRYAGSYSPPYALSAIRVYSGLPKGWPNPPGTRTSPPLSFPWISVETVDQIKLFLACLGATLMVLLYLQERRSRDTKTLERALVVVGLVAGMGWWSFLQLTNDEYQRSYRNPWDVLHYYSGAKYSPELQYVNLYRCMMAADLEDGFRGFHQQRHFSRDLETNLLIPTSQLMSESGRCKEVFTPERWAEFKHDLAWFRTKLPPADWSGTFHDHGYNPSPVWAVLGRPLASLSPMSNLQFDLLMSLDTLLLALMWCVIWWTFGPRIAAMGLIFWGTNIMVGTWFTGGAFLRNDWLALVVIGLCCLKKEKARLGVFLITYAALLRLFPVFVLVGLALGALVDLYRRRSWIPTKKQRDFIVGAALAVLLLGGLSILVNDRTSVWKEFIGNTMKHRATPQTQNVGLRALVTHIDRADLREYEQVSSQEVSESYTESNRQIIPIVLAILFLPLLVVAVAGREPWVAAVLGLTLLPFATDVSNYYYAALLIFAFLTLSKKIVGVGFAALTLASSLLGVVYSYGQLGLFTFGSLTTVLFMVWIALVFALDRRAPGRSVQKAKG